MPRSLPNTLLLGDSKLEEFGPVVSWLRDRDQGGALRTAADLADSRNVLARGEWVPDLVVVLQSWPDQYSTTDFHELLTVLPLARIVGCFGPWCDSDGRTRSIWPLAVRVPAAAAIARLEHEWKLFEADRDSAPPLPLTASRTEIFEFDCRSDRPFAAVPGKIAVISPDRTWREMMQRLVGWPESTAAGDGPPALVLFDADRWGEERAEELAAIRAAAPAARLVALVGFPRPDLETELRRGGADAVRFKL